MQEESEILQWGRAKINLTLDVTGLREDGFHEVCMVMQSLHLADEIRLRKLPDGQPNQVFSSVPFLKADAKNLAYRAITLIQERCGVQTPVALTLKKHIPISAGLAGGSTDAAAVLRAMNKLFELGLKQTELMELGAELGSDVPFCVAGGTKLAVGRGEKISRVCPLPTTEVVLIKPDFGISTPWAYQQFDLLEDPLHPDYRALVEVMKKRDASRLQSVLGNSLEKAAVTAYPVIMQLQEMLQQQKAFAWGMSGSGPTVFGMFRTAQMARIAVEALRPQLPENYVIIRTWTENPKFDRSGSWI